MSSPNFLNPATGRNNMTPAVSGPELSPASSAQADPRATAGDAMSRIGDVAKQTADEAKRSATTLASEANVKVKALLGQQVGVGADLVGHVAASARVAAGDLKRNAPQLADLVRDASERLEQFSRDVRGQSIDQLVRRTSDFARERPAVMFGAAAAAGFFLLRLFKAGTSRPAIHQPRAHDHDGQHAGRGYQPEAPSIAPHYGPSHGA